MTQAALTQKRIRRIESELETLKRYVAITPDALIDEKNWKSVKNSVKSVRASLFAKLYGGKEQTARISR